ncbi:hypothetical protein 2204_scaffold812_00046 [Bacteriophage sp.]|nr:hypothetical protein 2204_scaffold812_00046 [Bacteriophage sp.]
MIRSTASLLKAFSRTSSSSFVCFSFCSSTVVSSFRLFCFPPFFLLRFSLTL